MWEMETNQTPLRRHDQFILRCLYWLAWLYDCEDSERVSCPDKSNSKDRALLTLSHILILNCSGWKPKHKHVFEQESKQLVLLPVLEPLLIKQVWSKQEYLEQTDNQQAPLSATRLTVSLIQIKWMRLTSFSLRCQRPQFDKSTY